MGQKLRCVLLGSFLCAAIGSLSGRASAEDCVPWQPTIDAARGVAAQTDRLVLIHFWATSCGPCKKVEREVFSQPKFAEQLSATFVPVKVNMDVTPEMGAYFGVNIWPTDVLMTPAGKVLATLRCPPDAHAYLAQLNQVAALQRQGGQVQLVQYPQPQYSAQQQPYRQPISATPSLAPAGPGVAGYPPQGGMPNAAANNTGAPAAYGGSPYGAAPPATAGPNPYAQPAQAAYAPPAQQQPGNPYQSYAPQGQSPYAPPTQPGYAQQGQAPYSPPNQAPASGAYPPGGGAVGNYAPANQASMVASAQSPAAQSTNATSNQVIPGSRIQPEDGGLVAALIERRQANAAKDAQKPAATPDAAPGSKPNAIGVNPVQLPYGSPPLGLDGYCPVTLDQGRWQLGDPRWGAIHLGRTYLFKGQEEQRQFLANPEHYSPMLSGNDPVLAIDQHQAVPGSRSYGARTKGSKRLYLFSSKETYQQFARNSARYEKAVDEAFPTASQTAQRQQQAANPPMMR